LPHDLPAPAVLGRPAADAEAIAARGALKGTRVSETPDADLEAQRDVHFGASAAAAVASPAAATTAPAAPRTRAANRWMDDEDSGSDDDLGRGGQDLEERPSITPPREAPGRPGGAAGLAVAAAARRDDEPSPPPVALPPPRPQALETQAEIVVGIKVVIAGLRQRADLNGKVATVVAQDTGRWAVEVEGPKAERVGCRPENLTPVICQAATLAPPPVATVPPPPMVVAAASGAATPTDQRHRRPAATEVGPPQQQQQQPQQQAKRPPAAQAAADVPRPVSPASTVELVDDDGAAGRETAREAKEKEVLRVEQLQSHAQQPGPRPKMRAKPHPRPSR